MDPNTPSEGTEKKENSSEDGGASNEKPTPEENPAPQAKDSVGDDSVEPDVDVVEANDHGDTDKPENAKLLEESEENTQNSSHEDDDSVQESNEQPEASASSKPKRLSRLAENDKPPEDPKFRFLSDPERDGKGLAAADDSKEPKDDGKPRDADRKNRKKVSRIPSARRGNRASGQCENCGGCQNVRRPHEDPAGEQRQDRGFQRNTRERNSYPGPRRRDSRGDDQQKWGHAMYYELYGEEQGRPQRPRRRGRGEYHGGGAPRDFNNNNNNRDEHRQEGNDGNPRYNGNRRPEPAFRSDRFGGPRRQSNNAPASTEKNDENSQKSQQNHSNGDNSGGERGGRRGQGSFRGRGSFRRRNNQKQPSTEKKEGESVPATANA